MAESFNADFYRTCAIVIPALFVSLAVQAQSYESELRRGERTPLPRRWLILNVAYLYVVFGGIGELVALLALFERSDALVWRVIVLIATLLVLSAVMFGPFWGYLRTVRNVMAARPRRRNVGGAQANLPPSAVADREEHDAGASPDTGT